MIKDFNTADDKAESAEINWSKDAGESSTRSIDAALRFELHNPALQRDAFRLTPAAGLEFEGAGEGEDKKRLFKYFGLVDLEIYHNWPVLKSSHFEIGPVFEDEREQDIEKLTGLIEWEPHLRVGGLATGVPYPLLGVENTGLYVYPVLAVELNNVTTQPEPKEGEDPIPDASYFRYGFKAGLTIGKRLSCTYELSQRTSISGDDADHTYQDGALEYFLEEKKRLSLKLFYKRGEDSPDFEKVERYGLGLGVKF